MKACIQCAAGKTATADGALACNPCQIGTYYDAPDDITEYFKARSSNYGQDIAEDVYKEDGCPDPAKTCTITQQKDYGLSLPQCTVCPIHYYQNEPEKPKCIACAIGEYQNQESQIFCTSCPEGKYHQPFEYETGFDFANDVGSNWSGVRSITDRLAVENKKDALESVNANLVLQKAELTKLQTDGMHLNKRTVEAYGCAAFLNASTCGGMSENISNWTYTWPTYPWSTYAMSATRQNDRKANQTKLIEELKESAKNRAVDVTDLFASKPTTGWHSARQYKCDACEAGTSGDTTNNRTRLQAEGRGYCKACQDDKVGWLVATLAICFAALLTYLLWFCSRPFSSRTVKPRSNAMMLSRRTM
jgi:hypothetical protein